MNTQPLHRLLWDALVLPLPQAKAAWRSWRAAANLDRLDTASFCLLPALTGRLPEWLANDPQQAILLGICRRAWSQNQIHRKLLADALEILAAAGIERVAATGPVLWGSLYWPDGAIRPMGTVDLLVEPASAAAAFEALSKAGWKAPKGIPDTSGTKFYFDPGVAIESPSGGQVRVHWRALPNTDISLRRPHFPSLQSLPPGQVARYALPLEYDLVTALAGSHEDGIDWRCDTLMICRQAVHWDTVAVLVRGRSKARNRLEELRRDWGLEVPQAVTKPPWTSGPEWLLASALRTYRRGKRAASLVWNQCRGSSE